MIKLQAVTKTSSFYPPHIVMLGPFPRKGDRGIAISKMLVGLSAVAAVAVPNVKLNNGVEMPMISLGTWQYNPDVAHDVVKLGLSLGFNHIDTANNYRNQEGVGKALAGINRTSYFLTTKVPSQTSAATAYAATTKDLNDDIEQLGLPFVDLMLVHFPPRGNTLHCGAMQEQWRAMEDFYKAKKARAIGVSNYCPSSFECIMKVANVTPAVNQVEYHSKCRVATAQIHRKSCGPRSHSFLSPVFILFDRSRHER